MQIKWIITISQSKIAQIVWRFGRPVFVRIAKKSGNSFDNTFVFLMDMLIPAKQKKTPNKKKEGKGKKEGGKDKNNLIKEEESMERGDVRKGMGEMDVVKNFFTPAILKSSHIVQAAWKILRPLLAVPAGITRNELDDKLVALIDDILDIDYND